MQRQYLDVVLLLLLHKLHQGAHVVRGHLVLGRQVGNLASVLSDAAKRLINLAQGLLVLDGLGLRKSNNDVDSCVQE